MLALLHLKHHYPFSSCSSQVAVLAVVTKAAVLVLVVCLRSQAKTFVAILLIQLPWVQAALLFLAAHSMRVTAVLTRPLRVMRQPLLAAAAVALVGEARQLGVPAAAVTETKAVLRERLGKVTVAGPVVTQMKLGAAAAVKVLQARTAAQYVLVEQVMAVRVRLIA